MKWNWKGRVDELKRLNKAMKSISRDQALYFVPGLFFVLLGLMICVAPNLFIAFIASFFIFWGITLVVLAWKVVQFQRKISGILRQINSSRIVVRTVDVRGMSEYDPYLEGKKIVFH